MKLAPGFLVGFLLAWALARFTKLPVVGRASQPMQLGLALLLIALGATMILKGIRGYSWAEVYAEVFKGVGGPTPGNASKTDPMKQSSGRKGGVQMLVQFLIAVLTVVAGIWAAKKLGVIA